MRRSGWQGQSYRHSLAARGISTGRTYNKGKFKRVAQFLTNDGRAETPDFEADMRLQEAERVRADAFAKLREAEDRGDITFEEGQKFFRDEFEVEVKDFLDNKRTAQQFREAVRIRIQRKTEPVEVMGTKGNPFLDGGSNAE